MNAPGRRSHLAKAYLLVAAALLPSLVAQNRSAEKYRLVGRVVDGLSGRPITDVELILSTDKWESKAEPVTPDTEGRFIFEGLTAGRYILSAARPDFETIFFGELPEPGNVEKRFM